MFDDGDLGKMVNGNKVMEELGSIGSWVLIERGWLKRKRFFFSF